MRTPFHMFMLLVVAAAACGAAAQQGPGMRRGAAGPAAGPATGPMGMGPSAGMMMGSGMGAMGKLEWMSVWQVVNGVADGTLRYAHPQHARARVSKPPRQRRFSQRIQPAGAPD